MPSNWSEHLTPMVEHLVGMNTTYQAKTQYLYTTGNQTVQTELFWEYNLGRVLDFSREACAFPLVIFLCFLCYYCIYYLWMYLLKPFLSDAVFLTRESLHKRCCPERKMIKRSSTRVHLATGKTMMEEKGLVSSYHIEANPFDRYQLAHSALTKVSQ